MPANTAAAPASPPAAVLDTFFETSAGVGAADESAAHVPRPIKEDHMSSIIIRHRVDDFDVWKAAFDEHGSVRREYGLADSALLRDEDDANMVTILMTTDDTARAREFLASDSLRETMDGAGVVSQPEVWIANDAA